MDEEAVAAKIRDMLGTQLDCRREPAIWFSVHVVSEALALEHTWRALLTLAELLQPGVVARVVVHFARSPTRWSDILLPLRLVRGSLSRASGVTIQAVGPFGAIPERVMESLVELSIRISFSGGWNAGCSPNRRGEVDAAALRAAATFGFMAPVTWYVHANNIPEIEKTLDDTLVLNYCSGFSLPLASSSPYYRFGDGFPNLPDAMEYCGLLVRTYERFPHYDELLAPVNELAVLVRDGGWHSQLDLPAAIQLLLDADGKIGMYRQTPALAVPWTSASEVVESDPGSLRESLATCARKAWDWQRNSSCGECRLRYICGGMDPFVESQDAASGMDCMCAYRKLFVSHFACLRAPTVVSDATKRAASSS